MPQKYTAMCTPPGNGLQCGNWRSQELGILEHQRRHHIYRNVNESGVPDTAAEDPKKKLEKTPARIDGTVHQLSPGEVIHAWVARAFISESVRFRFVRHLAKLCTY